MDVPMDSAGGDESRGVDLNPQDQGLPLLYSGIERGFHNVMAKLSEIDGHLDSVPTKTAHVLAKQRGLSEAENSARASSFAAASEASRDIDVLTTKNQELENEKMRLEARIKDADEDIERRATTEAELKKELLDLKREVARLQKKEVQFRDIILSSAGTQKITDQEVIQTFSDLRQKVQQLASSSAFDLTNISTGTTDSRKQGMSCFYTMCRGLRSRDAGHRLKAEIFYILDILILSRTCFGLKRERHGGDEKERLWYIEEHLRDFEQLLSEDPRVNEGVIADWRICTLDCIDLLKLPEEYSLNAAAGMESFFAPLISKKASQNQREEIRNKTVEVCQKAVKLKMMMQRSKEGYFVYKFDVNHFPLYSKVEYFADSMGVENGKSSDASDDIAYLLFGALAKHAKQLGGERKTLVKAEVILKKKA